MKGSARTAAIGIAVVAIVVVALWVIAAGPGSDRSVSNLGPDRFDTLRPAKVARDAAEGPLFFPDPLDEGRELYVGHEGDDPDTGFIAFGARNPSTDCLVQYDTDAGDLFDLCDGSRHPADGSTLYRYPVEVRDDRLIIDLNFQERGDQ